MSNYQEIYQYLLDHPDALLTEVARRFDTHHGTINRKIKQIYGYSFADRKEAQYQAMRDRVERSWPRLLNLLETTDTSYRELADQLGLGSETVRLLIKSKGYNMQTRRIRIIKRNNSTRNKPKPPPEPRDVTLPHSLPLNELWRAVG